jgi:DUF438 domain-containing protein
MIIPNTNITLEELLDCMPLSVQYVDKNGFLRYLNETASKRPANCKREVGVNIQDCHAKPESHEMIERIFEDFRQGRKEPHYYVSSATRKTVMVPIFDAENNFLGVLSYSHPVGLPESDRTF